jgi:hypothetical protein
VALGVIIWLRPVTRGPAAASADKAPGLEAQSSAPRRGLAATRSMLRRGGLA